MGGSSTSTKHETTSNQINPYQMQQYQQNYADAQNRFAGLKPYTGPLTAGFNDTQLVAQNRLLNLGNDASFAQPYDEAMGVNRGILGQSINPTITPQSVSATTYDPAQLAGRDLSPYMNPFQKNVIDASIAQNQFARDQQGVADNAAATASHAFGGSRQGVQRALTTEGYDRNNQQNLAALNSANFGQAQQAALSDVASQNAAGQFNAGQRQAAGIFNAGQDFNAQQNSFANMLANNQFRLGAANNLTALSDARLANNTRQAGILASVGDARQQQDQLGLTNDYNAYLQEFNRQLMQQQALNQALGIIPIEQTSTSDGTQTTKTNPGIGGVLGGIGSLALGVGSLGTSTLGGSLLGGLFGSSLRGQSSGSEFGWT